MAELPREPLFSTPLEAARWWIEQGTHVVPILPYLVDNNGKHAPRPYSEWKWDDESGPKPTGRLISRQEVDAFWSANPEAQVAICLGGGLGAIDVDLVKRPQSDARSPPAPIGDGFRETTKSAGEHILFRYKVALPPNKPARAIEIGGYVDVLCNGILFTAPSAFKNSSGRYEVVSWGPVPEFTQVSEALAASAAWLVDAWKSRGGNPRIAEPETALRTESAMAGLRERVRTRMRRSDSGSAALWVCENTKGESRDAHLCLTLTQHVLLAARAEGAATLEAAQIAEELVACPDRRARDIAGYKEREPAGLAKLLQYPEGRLAYRELTRGRAPTPMPVPSVVGATAEPLPPMWVIVAAGKESEHEAASQVGFVSHLMAQHHFVAPRDTDELLVYTSRGIYERGDPLVESWVERQFSAKGASSRSSFRKEVAAAVRAKSYVDRSDLNPPGLVCLANGVLETADFGFLPHTPELRFTARLEVNYDPQATCPVFDRFFSEAQPDEKIRELLDEWAGYGLEDGYPYQLALVNVGEGDNGKGTWASTLIGIYKGACSAESLQSLNSRFGPASLYGCRVNVADELPAGELGDTSKFKALTGGSLVKAERKGQDPFTFVNSAKFTFIANALPRVNDRTRAFWRRIVLVRWDYIVPPEKKDHHLQDKINAELSGVLNRAVAGLRRVRARRGLGELPTVADAAEAWRRVSDSLAYFADQMLERDPGSSCTKQGLVVAYRQFCEERDLEPETEAVVGRRIPELFPGVTTARTRLGASREQTRIWRGVSLLAEPKVRTGKGGLDAYTGPPAESGESGESGGSPPPCGKSEGVRSTKSGATHPDSPASPGSGHAPVAEEGDNWTVPPGDREGGDP